MKKKLEIDAFGSSWFNCKANEKLSLLVSKDKSYSDIALLNSYFYFIEKTSENSQRLNMFHDEEFHNMLEHFYYEDIKLRNDSAIEEIKSLIDADCCIQIFVDLYEWVEKSFDYHKRHSNNYVIITGYDDEEQVLFCICDNFDGYMENAVPYENVKLALIQDGEFPHQIIRYKENIPHFDIKKTSFAKYAEGIIKSIDGVFPEKFWVTEDNSDIQFFVYIITKITERMRGNILMLDFLSHNGTLTVAEGDDLAGEANDIIKIWKSQKAILIKAFLRKRLPDFEKVNSTSREALVLEKRFWEKFLLYYRGD